MGVPNLDENIRDNTIEPSLTPSERDQEFNNHQIMDDEPMEENDGYLRLQQFDINEDYPANDEDSSNESSDEDDDMQVQVQQEQSTNDFVPPIATIDEEVTAEIWNNPRPQELNTSIELDSQKTTQILDAMRTFTLPNCPQWINDDLQLSNIVHQLKNKQPLQSLPHSSEN